MENQQQSVEKVELPKLTPEQWVELIKIVKEIDSILKSKEVSVSE